MYPHVNNMNCVFIKVNAIQNWLVWYAQTDNLRKSSCILGLKAYMMWCSSPTPTTLTFCLKQGILIITGDLKGTHVFEASSKPSDTFPTPTEFDPTAAAALATPPQTQTPPAQANSVNLNGGTVQQPTQQQTRLVMDLCVS